MTNAETLRWIALHVYGISVSIGGRVKLDWYDDFGESHVTCSYKPDEGDVDAITEVSFLEAVYQAAKTNKTPNKEQDSEDDWRETGRKVTKES